MRFSLYFLPHGLLYRHSSFKEQNNLFWIYFLKNPCDLDRLRIFSYLTFKCRSSWNVTLSGIGHPPFWTDQKHAEETWMVSSVSVFHQEISVSDCGTFKGEPKNKTAFECDQKRVKTNQIHKLCQCFPMWLT